MAGTDHSADDPILAQGYNTPGDGGGGWFYRTSTTGACTSDYGIVFQDTQTGPPVTHKNCYTRRFTGTVYMAWFGVKNSIITFGSNPSTTYNDVAFGCGGASCWDKAFAAAALLAGNNTVSTGGMYLYSSKDVHPSRAGQTLTCDAPFTLAEQASDYSSNVTVTGAIVLLHGAKIHFDQNANEFHHCVVLTIGGATGSGTAPEIDLAPNSFPNPSGGPQRAALNNDKYMVTNGDIGVFCDGGDSNYIHDVTVIGFDTGIGSFGCSQWRVTNVNIDAPVPIYLQNDKSPSFINHVRSFPILQSNVHNRLTQFYITSIVSGTGNICHVTIYSSATDPGIKQGDWISLVGDGMPAHEGPLSCYGTFQANSDSSYISSYATVDLAQTVYGDSSGPFNTVSASWVANSQIVNVTGPMVPVQQGQCVTSSTDPFPYGDMCVLNGTPQHYSVMVKDVSYYSRKIVIDQPTTGASSGTATLSFTNYGTYSHSGTGTGGCSYDFTATGVPTSCSFLTLAAAPHIDAGNSIGGVGAGHIATCVMGGGPGDTSTLGVIGGDIYCFEHRRHYYGASVGPFACHGCGADSDAQLSDIQQIGLIFGRGTDPLELTGRTTVSTTFDNLSYNPVWAGWNVNDHLIFANGDIRKITGVNPSANSVTLDLATSSPGSSSIAAYDVKFQVGSNTAILSGSASSTTPYTISILGGANPKLVWTVGDILVEPVTSRIPAGARIVSMTTSSVTLNVPVTASFTNALIGDTTVNVVGTRGGDFAAAVLGGGGGVVFDSNSNGCNSVRGKIDEANFGQVALEVVQGCALVTSVSESQTNDFMIDTGGVPNTTAVITGTNANGGIFFEGPAAAATFAGNGNTFAAGGTANTQTFGDTLSGTLPSGYYPCPTSSGGVLVVFCGGNGLSGTAGGNAYETCNQLYPVAGLAGCVQTAMDSSGNWKQINSVNNTVYEFKDGSQALLPMPYQDQLQGKLSVLATVASAAISVVSSCAHTGCTSGGSPEGIRLPLTTGWIDAGSWASTPCATPGTGNCGVAGPITIVNYNGSSITVWPTGGTELVNHSSGYAQAGYSTRTYYPILGVGWVSTP